MNERRVFSLAFANSLKDAGFSVTDLEQLSNERSSKKTSAVRAVSRFTGFPPAVVNNGLRRDAFEEQQLKILPVIRRTLNSWISTSTDEFLPTLQVLEIARQTRISPERVIGILNEYPVEVAVNGTTLITSVKSPELPKTKIAVKDASKFGVKPKRVIKAARYLSRPQGGGAIQKAGFQESRVDGIARTEARKKSIVIFETVATGEISESPASNIKLNSQYEERTSGNENLVAKVMEYFDENEFKRTIPGRYYLKKRLTDIAYGLQVPLVVFNCLDFAWEPISASYPTAKILDDTESSIIAYFKEKLQATVSRLSVLSPTGSDGVKVSVIIPDSELFDDRVFPFIQSYDDRKQVGEKVKKELVEKLQYENVAVMYWSDYCRKYDLKHPDEYTSNAASLISKALGSQDKKGRQADLERSVLRQLTQSKKYFVNKGLDYNYVNNDIPSPEMLERIIWYCAMYMGEGQALAESNAIVLNFEDFRVGKWYNIGSSDRLPIVTPVNPNEYYRWRNNT